MDAPDQPGAGACANLCVVRVVYGREPPDGSMSDIELCIFVPCYNVEEFVENTIQRAAWHELAKEVKYRVVFVDNQSTDGTWDRIQNCLRFLKDRGVDAEAIRNPVNLGYGGSNKLVFDYCLKHAIDSVGILHSDGQYAPEELCRLVREFRARPHCALFYGSRLRGSPLKGGMPLHKFFANKALTRIQNMALGSRLSEFHSGYRFYRLRSIRRIPYHENSDYYHFDTQIIFQIHHTGGKIEETPIPTFYGEEKSYLNGLKTAVGILANVGLYLLHAWGLKRVSRFTALPS